MARCQSSSGARSWWAALTSVRTRGGLAAYAAASSRRALARDCGRAARAPLPQRRGGRRRRRPPRPRAPSSRARQPPSTPSRAGRAARRVAAVADGRAAVAAAAAAAAASRRPAARARARVSLALAFLRAPAARRRRRGRTRASRRRAGAASASSRRRPDGRAIASGERARSSWSCALPTRREGALQSPHAGGRGPPPRVDAARARFHVELGRVGAWRAALSSSRVTGRPHRRPAAPRPVRGPTRRRRRCARSGCTVGAANPCMRRAAAAAAAQRRSRSRSSREASAVGQRSRHLVVQSSRDMPVDLVNRVAPARRGGARGAAVRRSPTRRHVSSSPPARRRAEVGAAEANTRRAAAAAWRERMSIAAASIQNVPSPPPPVGQARVASRDMRYSPSAAVLGARPRTGVARNALAQPSRRLRARRRRYGSAWTSTKVSRQRSHEDHGGTAPALGEGAVARACALLETIAMEGRASPRIWGRHLQEGRAVRLCAMPPPLFSFELDCACPTARAVGRPITDPSTSRRGRRASSSAVAPRPARAERAPPPVDGEPAIDYCAHGDPRNHPCPVPCRHTCRRLKRLGSARSTESGQQPPFLRLGEIRRPSRGNQPDPVRRALHRRQRLDGRR